MAAKVVSEYFKSQGLKHDIRGDKGEVIFTGFNLESSGEHNILMFFSDDNSAVQVVMPNVGNAAFPADKLPAMYELCSKLNKEYRWVKFYVDEESRNIRATDDGVIQLDSCGPECERLLIQLVRIVDQVYSRIMKAFWS